MFTKSNSGKENNVKENGQNTPNLNQKEFEQNKVNDNISEKNNKENSNDNFIIGTIEIQEPQSIKRIINSFENLKREAPNWYWNLTTYDFSNIRLI